MAKKRINERTIIFTKDYSNKKEGTIMKCDVTLSSVLVKNGVAELIDKPFKVEKEEIKKPKKTKRKNEKNIID